jgi:hypothetical protein
MHEISSKEGFSARVIFYTLMLAGLGHGLALLAQGFGGHEFSVEGSPVEWAHVLFSLLASCFFLSGSKVRPDYRLLLRVMAALCFAASMREVDKLSSHWVFENAYWMISLMVVIWASVPALKSRAVLTGEIRDFIGSPCFLLAWVGLVTIMFAQLFGQKELWQAVMETSEEPYRTAKNMAEEGVEFLGYIFLIFAAAEARFLPLRSQSPQQP